jgi:hypothetical protein
MLARKSISPTKILLTLIFGYAALRSMRHIPLFAIVVIPILAEQVGSLIKIRSEVQISSRLRWIVPVILALLVLVTGLRFSQVVRGQPQAESETFPKSAVDWMLVNKPEGNLFNSYGWGGYLIWRLYPEYHVYIDGRADMYGDKFIFDYMGIYRAETGLEDKLTDQNIGIVLVEPEAPLANTLRRSAFWRVVFEDQTAVIFTH